VAIWLKIHFFIYISPPEINDEFRSNQIDIALTDQKKQPLKAKIAVAL
jgi:hypothetical protein